MKMSKMARKLLESFPHQLVPRIHAAERDLIRGVEPVPAQKILLDLPARLHAGGAMVGDDLLLLIDAEGSEIGGVAPERRERLFREARALADQASSKSITSGR